MASTKVLLKTAQPKNDGTIPILIRVTAGRRSKYFSTGYAVKQSQFKEGLENWVIKHPDSVLINAAIESKRSVIAEKIYKADIAGTKIDIKSIAPKKGYGTFLTAIKARLTVLEGNNQVAAYNKLHAKLAIVKEAWGKDVQLGDITKALVDKYISHRLKTAKISTIKKDLSDFSAVLASVEFEGKDYFKPAQKKLVPDSVIRERLSLEEIRTLEDLPLTGLNDVARDMFLFSFYCHGMRFQNVALFDSGMISKGAIRYRMNKGKKVREIEIHERLQRIIDKYDNKPYLFPVVKKPVKDNWDKKLLVDSANALINTRLKRVAIIAGIEKNLHFHLARHTFAFLSLERGVSYPVLKDALGHSNFNTTQAYLKSLSDSTINEAVKGLYD